VAGGSGGAIKLEVGTLAGAGSIHAGGGVGHASFTGGGGGGRVAIFFDDASGFNLGNVTTSGGPGLQPGQAGSIVAE
jgi:hypothetical protein